MSPTKPPHLHLAELAYNAYHQEQPQVWFDDLNQIAQMKWVRAIRAVLEDRIAKSKAIGAPGTGGKYHWGSIEEAKEYLKSMPRSGGKSRRIKWIDLPPDQRLKGMAALKYITNRKQRKST